MSFLLSCPNCGPRDVCEFRYGGQVIDGPSNLAEVQRERWHHRFGCGRWLVAERDIRTNKVLSTGWLEDLGSEPSEGAS